MRAGARSSLSKIARVDAVAPEQIVKVGSVAPGGFRRSADVATVSPQRLLEVDTVEALTCLAHWGQAIDAR